MQAITDDTCRAALRGMVRLGTGCRFVGSTDGAGNDGSVAPGHSGRASRAGSPKRCADNVAAVGIGDNDIGGGVMHANEQQRARREQVSARLDPDVLEVVERVAAAERRPVSNLVRNIVADWAAARAQGRAI
jgi:hypothetical protein